MVARSGLMASTSSFAHLLGLGAANAGKKSAEEDPKKEPVKDKDDDSAKGNKKVEDRPDDQGEDETDEEYKERKKKEQEEADDEDDETDAKSKAARIRERARCAAIFASPHAAVRPDVAAHLAFETNMKRGDAVATLAISAQGSTAPTRSGRHGLSERMDHTPNPDIRPDADAAPPKPHQRLMAAHAKATGQKP